MDAHYTPRDLATRMVASAADIRPSVIADLCAGRGDLLLQAEEVWPNAEYAAVDIDQSATRHLRRLRPQWSVGCCDLTNPNSRSRSSVLQRMKNRISLLLLNPPFSCRGGRRYSTTLPNRTIYSSVAMTFLITSLYYLHHLGSAVVVLPYGSLYSQKDQSAWTYIKRHFNVTVVNSPKRSTFPNTSANVAVVKLSPIGANTKSISTPPRPDSTPIERRSIKMIRGSQPVHRTRGRSSGPVLIHSTELRDALVYANGRRGFSTHRTIIGPAVLLPRVGRITKGKIAISCSDFPIVLSDCVIGIITKSLNDAKDIRRRLVDSFQVIKAQYVGTGAPFVTIERLTDALSLLGIDTYDS